MADKSANAVASDAGRVPTADRPDSIRNVVLVGPSGSAKTTLLEALLAASGVVTRPGRVEDGTTISDFDEAEVRQKRSIGLSLAPLVYHGVKVNLLDTPGYADFVGEVRAGLRAADCALFVISATDGVDGTTTALWEECASVGMPRAVVITKLDHPRADYQTALQQAQDAFGDKVLPLYLPINGTDGPTGLYGILSQKLFDYSSGTRTETDAGDGVDHDQAELARGSLLEGIIEESEDETLMDRYLSGETLDYKSLIDDLETAVARSSFFPVLPVGSASGVGMDELLEIMTNAFPSPLEHPMPEVTTVDGRPVDRLEADPEGPLLAEVVKTTSDPYVGRINLVRIFSGTLRADAQVHVCGHFSSFFGADRGHADHDEDEKVGSLSIPLGKTQRNVVECIAGDIAAVGKLTRAETGDTLSGKDRPMLMRPWSMPEPLLPTAIRARSKADEDKLSQALTRIAAEDPTLRVEQNAETHQLVLWCLGEAHTDVVLDKLDRRYSVQVDPITLRVPLRETFGAAAKARGRHVKQSGGHGQFAICDIEVEPLPEGSGFEFADRVVGGAVPRQFIPSVEKGLRAQMEHGVAAGYPVVDIRVTLVDGKAHSVDSSDMAFQTAGALALREAAKDATINLLEPVDLVQVLIDDDYVGTIMGDMSSRRGRVLGTESIGQGRTLVKAEVPEIEVVRYATDLRSMSHGTGTFTRDFVRYEPMPSHVAEKVKQQQQEPD